MGVVVEEAMVAKVMVVVKVMVAEATAVEVMVVEAMVPTRAAARVPMAARTRAKVVTVAARASSHVANGRQATVLMATAVDFHTIHDLEAQHAIQFNTKHQ